MITRESPQFHIIKGIVSKKNQSDKKNLEVSTRHLRRSMYCSKAVMASLYLAKRYLAAIVVTIAIANLAGHSFSKTVTPESEQHTAGSCALPENTVDCAQWASRVSTDFEDVQVAILPLGSIEQHGPHLPLGTDMMLAEAYAKAVATCRVPVLPVSPFGASSEHAHFPGTLTVSDETLHQLWGSLIDSIASTGVRKIILLNAHGGQSQNAEIVARNARFSTTPPTLAVTVNLQSLFHDVAYSVVSKWPHLKQAWEWESKHGIHGGLLETALMLYLHPRLVRMEYADKFLPRPELQTHVLKPHGSYMSYGWRIRDLTASGALGDASLASVEIGKELFRVSREKLERIVADVLQINVDTFFSS